MPRGTRRLPDECIRRLEQADLILHAGDFVAAAVLEDLRSFAPVKAVVGNMDEAALRSLLPVRRVVEVDGIRIGMVHDAGPAVGRRERLTREFGGCSLVVYGHTHVPELARVRETWILNPGSPTERRSAPNRSMAVVQVRNGRLDVRTYVL
jgi:putative phosphoesterase